MEDTYTLPKDRRHLEAEKKRQIKQILAKLTGMFSYEAGKMHTLCKSTPLAKCGKSAATI